MSNHVIISVCALALSVGACAGVVWTTFAIRTLSMRLASSALRLSELSVKLSELTNAVTISTPATLRAQIEDLAAAVATNSATVRRELGRLWARQRKDEREEPVDSGEARDPRWPNQDWFPRG